LQNSIGKILIDILGERIYILSLEKSILKREIIILKKNEVRNGSFLISFFNKIDLKLAFPDGEGGV